MEPVLDSKASPSKKAVVPPKGKQAVEEIIDNRPRTVQLKRDFALEHGDQGFRFTEPVASKFKSNFLTIQVIENEVSIEKIKIDLSEMLWPQEGKTVS